MTRDSHQGILGIHHITAIAGNPQKNIDFYTGFLGLRLVKLTVNFDDPQTYHFYYGDDIGRPGTILTFFPWQNMPKGFRGTGQVITTAFLIPESSIEYWINRFKDKGISHRGPTKRFNSEQIITFVDHDGVKLELVASKEAENRKINAWNGGPISIEHAVRGLHSITLTLEGYEKTVSLLTDILGFSKIVNEDNRVRFQIDDTVRGEKVQTTVNSAPSIVDIICHPYSHRGTSGPGTVHHVAWRTPTNENQAEIRNRIVKFGLNVTPIIDRVYFNSIYFREPGDVLFEIATDTPGFLVDQESAELGNKLVLPKWLEPKRIYLEKTLPSLKIPSNENIGPETK